MISGEEHVTTLSQPVATGMRQRRMEGMKRIAGLLAIAVVVAGCGSSPVAARLDSSRHAASTGSCDARRGTAAITLTYTMPSPTVIVHPGADVAVTVPAWGSGTATQVHVVTGGILREQCTTLLAHGGRRTIFQAARSGSAVVTATVTPASDAMMPVWSGKVIVRG
jgi:O-acetyl-ADP-ribose deacetylase (regulator of RNase III)